MSKHRLTIWEECNKAFAAIIEKEIHEIEKQRQEEMAHNDITEEGVENE